MPTDGADHNNTLTRLLTDDDPAPFQVVNGESKSPVLLICDHASRRIPAVLGNMGLDPAALRCHLALDIGAGKLTRSLAARLSLTAVLCEYSRLVVDCNRELLDPGAFLEFGDGVVVMGNRNLNAAAKQVRADEIYWPYHNAVTSQVERLLALGRPPVFVSLHSFTPVLNGETRHWEMGVLWDTDQVTAEIFLHDLRAAGFDVGDNQPYSGKAPQDFTIDHHAESVGLSHVGIEIRQDLIDDDQGVAEIAAVFEPIIASLSARLNPATLRTHGKPLSA